MNVLRRERLKKFKWHAFLAVSFESDNEGGYNNAAIYGKVKGPKGRGIYTVQEEFLNQEDFETYILDLKEESYQGEPCRLAFYNLNQSQWFMENLKKTALYRPNAGIYRFDLKNGLTGIDISNYVHLELSELSSMDRAKLIFRTAEQIQDGCKELGVTMFRTPASTGFVLLKSMLPCDLYRNDGNIWNNYEAEGYYGGRVECYKTGIHNVQSYDVVGMYLNIMATCKLPYPQSSKMYTALPWEGKVQSTILPDWKSLEQAMITCEVYVHPTYIPVLPKRINHQLIFPTGHFSGTWTNLELHEAIKQGTDILSIQRIANYSESNYLCKDFAELVGGKRNEHKWLKTLGNSIYGKFGQKAYGESTYTKLSDYDGTIDELSEQTLTEMDGEDWVHQSGKFIGYYDHSFVCISAFIASMARLQLYNGIIGNENNLIYCDTDCLKTTSVPKNLSIGTALGQWKLDHNFQDVEFFGAKDYVMPEEHVIAGIPKNATLLKNEKRTYSFNRTVGYREGIITGQIPTTNVRKEIILHEEDTKREHIGNGFTCPINLGGNE